MNKTLLLVDGSSYLYRAFHAMPNLRNAQGMPTGALYGVINMMRKISRDFHADYLACVFDAKGKTFRDDIYKEYKANRPSMPEDLALQIKPIHKAIAAMGWPVLVIDGVEADDVIATLARWADQDNIKTIISTGDKDLAQLVNERISLINTMSQESLDEQGVKQKFGVTPAQMVDYLMLIGDIVDNVPGVPKVGPKTAAKWLNKYQTLENLIQHSDEISGVVGQNLRLSIDQFKLTRKLITIKNDCSISQITSLENLRWQAQDDAVLKDIYHQYGFRTWLQELTGDTKAVPRQDARITHVPPQAPESTDYVTVNTAELLRDCLHAIEQATVVALDTETNSLDTMRASLVGISLSIKAGQGWYIPLAHTASILEPQLDKKETLNILKSWLENEQTTKVLQNAKFDMHVLTNEGISLKGVKHDVMLMAYVLESNKRVGLEELAQRYLGRTGVSYESLCGKGVNAITFDQVPIDKASFYACEDADFTLQVFNVLLPMVSQEPGLQATYELEMQVSPVLFVMERNGVRLDVPALRQQSQAFEQRLQELEKQAYAMVGGAFNLNSPKQLAEILFVKMGLPVIRKTPKGAPSTDEDVLTKLAYDYPLPKVILENRGLAKLKSTYTDKLPRMIFPGDGRVHTHYSQASVVTGRLASSDPNLQNIPVRNEEGKRIREAFIAENGSRIISADYSQIELRVMAHLSDDENLCKAFAEGKDIHRATAAEIFGVELDQVSGEQRRSAKAINFGLIYGMGVFGLAANLGITRDAAQMYIDRYFARYPGVAHYMEMTRHKAMEQGYVETVFGRRLWFNDLKGAKGPRRAAAERAAINAPMQGTAADLIKIAMVKVQAFLEKERLRTLLIMQVHDELVLEVPDAEADIIRSQLSALMCSVAELKVPLEADVGEGKNWSEAH